MNRIDGDLASKIILSLGVALLIAERFWIPATTVFWVGILFCFLGLRRIEVFDQGRTSADSADS